MNDSVAGLAVISVIISIFVYTIGRIQGSQIEKGKQNEKELETIKNAVDIRNNANISKLRKKYKTK